MRLWRKLFETKMQVITEKDDKLGKVCIYLIFFSNLFLSISLGPQLNMRTKHSYYQLLGKVAKNLILSLFSLIPFLYWEYCWMNSSEFPKCSKFQETWDSILNEKKIFFKKLFYGTYKGPSGNFLIYFFDDRPPQTFLKLYHIIKLFFLQAIVNKYGRWRENSGLVENGRRCRSYCHGIWNNLLSLSDSVCSSVKWV